MAINGEGRTLGRVGFIAVGGEDWEFDWGAGHAKLEIAIRHLCGDGCWRHTCKNDRWVRKLPLPCAHSFQKGNYVFPVVRFLNLHATLPDAHPSPPPHLRFSFSIIDEIASFMFQHHLRPSQVLGVLHFLHPARTSNQDLSRCVPQMGP